MWICDQASHDELILCMLSKQWCRAVFHQDDLKAYDALGYFLRIGSILTFQLIPHTQKKNTDLLQK